MSDPTSADEGSTDHELLAALADDFARRYRRGERPSIEEYARQHPALAEQIRELFPPMIAMELSSGAAAPPPTAPPAERVGAVIDHYKLLERLGEGGFGTVFMAEQQHPVRRKVALKLVKPGVDTARVIARFEAERQALALMDHPNIAKVFDAGATDAGRPYFVMELVKGVPITTYCDDLRLTPEQRLELFVPVCQAVQHAHQKGVIHRDLKPSNVLVALYDGKPVPKVIDFGVAKATGEQLTERTMFTGFGEMVGTLQYMSPEQAELNQLDVDTRSDVYSLGVLLYELLTGTTPLEGARLKQAALLEALRVIREEEPPRPSTRLSTSDRLPTIAANRGLEPRKLSGIVRGELDWIVMKCLEKDRARRYQSANALVADVQNYLNDEPVEAGPPSASYRFRKFARRNKGALIVAALVAAMLMGTVVVQAVNYWRIRREQARTLAALNDARTSRDRAREVLDQMTSRVIDDWLSRQPKLSAEQRQFLEFALARYEELARESGDTPAQRLALALANRRVGELRSRLGLFSDAGAALARAMTLLDALTRDHPEVPEYTAQRAATHTSMGHAHGNVGRPVEALAAYVAARDLMRQLVDAHPAVTGYSAALAGAENNVALLQTEFGRPEEARRSYESARDLLARLLRGAGDDKHANALATTLTNLAVVQAQLQQLSQAAKSCEEALVLAEPLVAAHPVVTEYRETLARAHNHLGNFRANSGQADEALKSLEAARALREQLVRDFPGVPQYAVDLGGTCCNLGHLLRYIGQPEAALAAYDVAVVNLQRAYQQEPRFDEAAAFLINTYGGQAAALAKLGRREAELKSYSSMCAVKQRRLRERGALPELAVDLAMSHAQVGLLHIALGRRDQALACFEAARVVLAGVSVHDDDRPDVLVNLGGTYCNMGVLLQRCDDPEASLEWFGKAIATLEPVNRSDLAGGNSGPFLVNCHAGRAHSLGKLDRPAEALEDWDRAIALDKAPNPPHRLERARTVLRTGDHVRAAAAAGELAEVADASPTVIYNAARVCSLCVPLVEQDASLAPPERERLADAYAVRSVELLRRAVHGGFKSADGLTEDADLNPLRRRADFQNVVSELEAKSKEPAPTTEAAAP